MLTGTLFVRTVTAGVTAWGLLADAVLEARDAPVSVGGKSDDLAASCGALAEMGVLFFTDAEGVGFTRVGAGVARGEVGGGHE